MAHYTKLVNGLQAYILEEVAARKKGSMASLFAGAAARYAGARAEKLFELFGKTEMLKTLGLVDGEMVDAEGLYAALIEQMKAEGNATVNIPLMGAITFNQQDIDMLYRRVING